MQAIAAHSPDDGRGIHIPVRDLLGDDFPQHHAKRPAGQTVFSVTYYDKF